MKWLSRYEIRCSLVNCLLYDTWQYNLLVYMYVWKRVVYYTIFFPLFFKYTNFNLLLNINFRTKNARTEPNTKLLYISVHLGIKGEVYVVLFQLNTICVDYRCAYEQRPVAHIFSARINKSLWTHGEHQQNISKNLNASHDCGLLKKHRNM